MTTADALIHTLQSPNVSDSNGEIANIVDAVANLANGVFRISTAITPRAAPGRDAQGGHVESLTEAVMGISFGLSEIASSINNLADAIREKQHETEEPPE